MSWKHGSVSKHEDDKNWSDTGYLIKKNKQKNLWMKVLRKRNMDKDDFKIFVMSNGRK